MVSEYAWVLELDKVVCFVPVYVEGPEGGNFTEVWMEGGERHLIKKKVKTVLRNVTSFFGMDLRQEYTLWSRFARKHTRPVVLGTHLTLVPVPVRRPRFRDEGGTGYVVLQKVVACSRPEEEDERGGFGSVVELKGGIRLPCLIRFERLVTRMEEGRSVCERNKRMRGELSKETGGTDLKSYMTIRVNKDTGEITFL